MGIDIDSLVIETTRRCNAKCGHCLRGDAENVVMPVEHLDTLFSRLGYVSSITFTGGEPSLVPEIMNSSVEIAEKYGVEIGNFYIATNAIDVSDEFLLAIVRLWCYCSDNECSQVEWSNDEYHPGMDAETPENCRFWLLRGLVTPRTKRDMAAVIQPLSTKGALRAWATATFPKSISRLKTAEFQRARFTSTAKEIS
jgi:hypothetical protein